MHSSLRWGDPLDREYPSLLHTGIKHKMCVYIK